VDAVDAASLEGLLHVGLEQLAVGLKLLRSFLIKWIVRVGFQEEVLQPVDNGVDGQDGLPVLAEDVEAHVPLQVDVWVVNLGLAFYFWRFVRILFSNLEAECELAVSIEALVRINLELELEQVVGVGEVRLARLRQLQLIDILCDS